MQPDSVEKCKSSSISATTYECKGRANEKQSKEQIIAFAKPSGKNGG